MNHWLIPCSPNIYNAEDAFNEYGALIWHQDCNMCSGDIAYIYVTAPTKEIRCKCLITEVDIPVDIGTDEGYVLDESFCSKSYRRYMELKLLEKYDCPLLGFHFLQMNGLSGTIRGQRKAVSQLCCYIENVVLSFSRNPETIEI